MPIDMSVELAELDLAPVLNPQSSIEPTLPAPSTPDVVEAPPLIVNDRAAFYKSLAADDVAKLRAATSRVSASRALIGTNMIAIGRELLSISNELPGHFEAWLRLEFSMSRASAYNYMNAAAEFADVPEVVETLPATTVYKLAAKATPAEVRDAVVREITEGKSVSAEAVEERISEAKTKAAEERRIEAERKKKRQSPANDDERLMESVGGYSGQNEIAAALPPSAETNAQNEPAARSTVAHQQKKDDGRREPDRAEETAHEALASLQQHLHADALETLHACAMSSASWHVLRIIVLHTVQKAAA